jgi:TetR/AcrR family transcriptional regulator, lmrAB and yxaGH operons repressor
MTIIIGAVLTGVISRRYPDGMADSRARMVGTAALLFQRHGYHAVGFRRIVEESGAPRGSIYHHFPGGKEQLGAEAVERSGAALLRTVEQVAAEADDVAGLLTGLGEVLAGWLESSGFEAGCPVATVALECAPDVAAITEACRGVFRGWVDLLAAALRAEGWAEGEAGDLALTVVAAVEGALILARVERDVAPLRAVLRDLARRAAAPLP